MKKTELQQIIREELQKVVKESLVNSQGYARDYYNLKSDIADTWNSIADMKSDMMNYFDALGDVKGSSSSVVTKGTNGLGGPKLVHAVADELIKIANKAKAKYK